MVVCITQPVVLGVGGDFRAVDWECFNPSVMLRYSSPACAHDLFPLVAVPKMSSLKV